MRQSRSTPLAALLAILAVAATVRAQTSPHPDSVRDPPDQVVAKGWIQESDGGGYVELSAPGKFGRYNWNLRLGREGNKITTTGNTASDLRVVPNDRGVECFIPLLANIK